MSPSADRLMWLLRHAKTLTDPPRGGGDHERKLAPRGRRDADALGRRLGADGDRLGLAVRDLPDLVLTSTAIRTAQTTERILAAMAHPPPVRALDSLYGATPDEVLDDLRAVEDVVRSVMVVGHNPTAHALAEHMVSPTDKSGRKEVARHGFPTCALAVYRLPVTTWGDVTSRSATLVGLFVPPF